MNTQIQIQVQIQVCEWVCGRGNRGAKRKEGVNAIQVNVQVFCGGPRRDGLTNLSWLRRVYINSNWPITVCSIVFVACGG